MTHTLFIRFCAPIISTTPGVMVVEWVLLHDQGEARGASAGTVTLAQGLQDVLGLQKEVTRVVALIPGEHVLVTTAPVYRRQKSHIAAALQYVVEEQLAAPVDSVHAALGKEAAPNNVSADMRPYLVAVIRKDIMDVVLNALTALQVVADMVTSDAFLVPYDAGQIGVFLEGGNALISAAPALVASVEQRNIELLLSSHMADPAIASAPPSVLHLYSTASDSAVAAHLDAWATRHALRFEYSVLDEPPLVQLCRNYSAEAPRLINLLQGPYTPQRNHLHQWPHLKTIAAILLIFFVSNAALVLAKTFYFQAKANEYHDLSVKEYHALFPDETRIVDLKAQLRQHLSQSYLQPDSFLVLLSQLAAKAGPSWPNQVIIRHMEYDGQKSTMTLEVQAPDIAQLDALKALLKSSSLLSGMDSVSQSGNTARSRVTISLQKSAMQ